MQRAANSPSTNSSSNTPGPPSKKQRVSNSASRRSSHNGTSVKPTPDSRNSDRRAIQAALEEEERKRQAALDRAAADAGETRWVLSFQEDPAHASETANGETAGLSVVNKGYAEIDWGSESVGIGINITENGEGDELSSNRQEVQPNGDPKDVSLSSKSGNVVGRRSFGRFNKMIERRQDPNYESSSLSSQSSSAPSSDSEDSQNEKHQNGDEDTDPIGHLIQSTGATLSRDERESNKATKAALVGRPDGRRNVPVYLDRLSSISAGGGADPRKGPEIECFKCKEKGHKARDCLGQDRTRDKSNWGVGKRRRNEF